MLRWGARRGEGGIREVCKHRHRLHAGAFNADGPPGAITLTAVVHHMQGCNLQRRIEMQIQQIDANSCAASSRGCCGSSAALMRRTKCLLFAWGGRLAPTFSQSRKTVASLFTKTAGKGR